MELTSPEARDGARRASAGQDAPEPPDAPPASVWLEVDRAAAVAEELLAEGQELHFGRDEETGALVIQVRDVEGNALRTVSPSEALSIASGLDPSEPDQPDPHL